MPDWEMTPQELTDLATKYSESSNESIGYEREFAKAAQRKLVEWIDQNRTKIFRDNIDVTHSENLELRKSYWQALRKSVGLE